MKPVRHPSNTRTLGAPAGWDQSSLPVEPLGITDTELEGVPCVMSFWQPDDVELANIAAGGLIGLSIVGRTMPPACVVTLYPAEPARGDVSTPWGHQTEAAGVTLEWPAYIAGMVETYLKSNPAPEIREAAIAGIIERRMWSAPKATTSSGALYHDTLQRIGTALGLPAGCDLTKACVPAIAALRSMQPATDAVRDVLAERRRQISAEGWTPEHDDDHSNASMAVAAAAYALADAAPCAGLGADAHRLWGFTGWAWSWFKRKGHRANLVRSGALILAEIERLDRANARAKSEGGKAP